MIEYETDQLNKFLTRLFVQQVLFSTTPEI